jgi:2-polyprenyl-6-methoxyphenol hydroxylase-like FAD-dependent oxidoreductase
MYDGEHRLFTMPFRVNEKQTMTMWQLSFVGLSEDDACAMRSQDPESLRAEALRRTQNCFEPVQDLIRETPAEEIWATGLYDRDPMQMRSKEMGTRVTIIGDAAHPMSMFKGQGANQAISDGPRLAKWLMKPTQKNGSKEIHTKIRCFEREMLQAAVPKVLASRAAAKRLHHIDALSSDYGFSGCKCDATRQKALKILDEGAIGAKLGGDLVQRVHAALLTGMPEA